MTIFISVPWLMTDHGLSREVFGSHSPRQNHILNVCFTVNGMVEKFGGTAGNIAYSLSLLHEKPIILATIGKDYQGYFDWLESNSLPSEGIKIISEEFTAGRILPPIKPTIRLRIHLEP